MRTNQGKGAINSRLAPASPHLPGECLIALPSTIDLLEVAPEHVSLRVSVPLSLRVSVCVSLNLY